MGKDYTWDKLNAIAEQWYQTPEEGNESIRKNLEIELFEGAMTLLSEQECDGLGAFWLNDWGKFDPAKGSFSRTLKSRISNRLTDMERKDRQTKRKDRPDAEIQKEYGEKTTGVTITEISEDGIRRVRPYTEEEKAQIWKGIEKQRPESPASLDGPVSADENRDETPYDQIAAPDGDPYIEKVHLDGSLEELLSIILTLPERLRGKANNPVRLNYFRLFFTDSMACLFRKERSISAPYVRHETELFRAMKLPFLDFFLTTVCRSVPTLMNSKLKLYGEMVKGRPMEEVEHEFEWYYQKEVEKLTGEMTEKELKDCLERARRQYEQSGGKYRPLPNDVYMAYLLNIEKTTVQSNEISPQRTAYYQFLRQFFRVPMKKASKQTN